MRKLLIGLFIVIFIISCHKDSTEEKSGKVKVVFWHAMGGPLGKVLNDMIEKFNKTHPNIEVIGVSMGSYDALERKLLASIVAREQPDISQNFETLTARFAKYNKIVALDKLIAESDEPNLKNDIIPVLLEDNSYNGVLYSFPFNKSVPVLYYNRDMFRKAGLDPDHPPQTVWELTEYAKKLTIDKDGDGIPEQYGFAMTQRNTWLFECRLLQFGCDLISKDGKSVKYDTPEGVQALQFYLNLIKNKWAYTAPGFEFQNDFIAQKVAMIESSVVSKVYMKNKIKFDWASAPIPYAKRKAVVISGTNINIFDKGDPKKIKAAWEFVKWFTNTENQVEWSLRTTYMPVRKSSLLHPKMLLAYKKEMFLKEIYEQMQYAYFEPRITAWYACRDKISNMLDQVFLVGGDPHYWLSNLTKEINMILKSYYEE